MSRRSPAEQRDHVLMEWERQHLDPLDRWHLGEPEMRGITAHVCQLLGVENPPLVRVVPRDEYDGLRGSAIAYSTGRAIVALEGVTTVTMLHEIAHFLTEDPLSQMECRKPVEREHHGDVWLGTYLALLDRFMGPKFALLRLHSLLPPGRSPKYYPTVWGTPRPVW